MSKSSPLNNRPPSLLTQYHPETKDSYTPRRRTPGWEVLWGKTPFFYLGVLNRPKDLPKDLLPLELVRSWNGPKGTTYVGVTGTTVCDGPVPCNGGL